MRWHCRKRSPRAAATKASLRQGLALAQLWRDVLHNKRHTKNPIAVTASGFFLPASGAGGIQVMVQGGGWYRESEV
ncbi:MAG: hypothetical protein PsegKO_13970 [Pseudohongiellaceae bacterium]